MAGNHDYVALEWVKGEIDSTLNQAQLALEDYVNNTEDSAKLRFCLNYIHQVHGTLQMVEFYGAALLAEEMEQLAKALLQEKVANPTEAIEVLMQAILQLPNYLSRLQSSQRDLPVVLLPLLNDLRASRGESLLSDTSLFTPDLSILRIPAPDVARQRLQNDKMVAQLRKLRQMYQFALAGIIRESDLEANYNYMIKVFQRLESICQDTPFSQLWRLSGGFTSGLQAKYIELSSGTKNVLRYLDANLKRMIEEHVDILGQPAPEDLAKHLLYYIARSEGSNSSIDSIRKDYRLSQALPSEQEVNEERQRMTGPDRGAIDSVVDALNEELARVKDQLDLFVRGEYKDASDLQELIPGLQQVSNTMAVLGLGIPRKVIGEQIEIIENLVKTGEVPDDNVLMDIAGALLYIEATLSGFGGDEQKEPSAGAPAEVPKDQVQNAHEAVIREARNGLEQAKTDIVEFIASHWDKSEIQGVPALLQSIRGGLKIIPLDQAADLLEACAKYIDEQLLKKEQAPDWSQLDTLADAITSIEYYLERLSEGSRDNDMILEVAEQSLAQLGYPIGGGAAAPAPVAAPQPAPPAAAPESSSEKATDQELIDDEIIEIFVEEAAEVLETIKQFYPSFQANPEDRTALTELRRAYHTLKGSGRLVGATAIGELAWAVENMLNRVIEGSIQTNLEMFELLEHVNDKLPELIESYKSGSGVADTQAYIDTAERLAAARKQARVSQEDLEEDSETEIEATLEAPEEDSDTTGPILPITPSEPASPSEFASGGALPTVEEEEEPEAESITEEPVAESTAAPAAVADDDDMIDDEIIEIFVEEAGEVLDTINEFLPQYLSSYDNNEALTEVRRAFHTLKGSGRLVGASQVGELSWSVENLLNRVLDGTIFMSDVIGNLITTVVGVLPDLVEDFKLQRGPSHNTDGLMEQAHALAKGEVPSSTIPAGEDLPDFVEPSALNADSMLVEETLDIDPALKEIFLAETESHLETLGAFVREAQTAAEPIDLTDDISRAMHTLKGSANTAGIEPIASVVVPVEKFVKEARAHAVKVDGRIAEMLADTARFVREGLDQVDTTPLRELEGTSEFLEKLQHISAEYLADDNRYGNLQNEDKPDPHLINLFLTDGVDILLDAERILNEWRRDPEVTIDIDNLVNELTTLAHGAHVAGLDDVAELAQALEGLYERAMKGEPGEDYFFDLAIRGHESLISMMDQVAAGLATQPEQGLIAELNALAVSLQSVNEPSVEEEESISVEEAAAAEIPVLEENLEDSTSAPEAGVYTLDPDLAEVFLEEANDIMTSSGEVIQEWSQDSTNLELVKQLQRDLHTLKGGARLAGIPPIGDLAHELESLFEGVVEGRVHTDEEAVNLALLAHDTLAGMVDSISNASTASDAPDLIEALRGYISGSTTDDSSEETEYELPLPEIDANGDDEIPVLEEVAPLDPEMVDIFLEEAQDIIHRTGETLHDWSADLTNSDLLAQLQRDLHTLKGGARMAEIRPIGDLAHELETLFERLTEGRLQPVPGMVGLATESHDRLAGMVDAVAQLHPVQPAQDLVTRIQAMASGTPHEAVEEVEEETDFELETPTMQVEELPEIQTDEELELPEVELSDETPDAESLAPAPAVTPKLEELDVSGVENETYDTANLDGELVSIFLEEAQELIDTTAQNLQSWLTDLDNIEHVKELQRALHTLKGGARMAEIKPIGDLSHELETLFEGIVEGRFAAEPSLSDLMLQCHDRLAVMVENVANQQPVSAANDLIMRVTHYYNHHAKGGLQARDTISEIEREQQSLQNLAGDTSEDELRVIFLDESRDIMEAVMDCFDRWKENPDNVSPARELTRDLATLNGGAKLAHVGSVSTLTEALTKCMESVVDGQHQISDEVISLVERSMRYISRLLDQIEQLEQPEVPNELIHELEQLERGEPIVRTTLELEVDPEILQVFIEEADELLSSLDRELGDWSRDPRNANHADAMARALHTLKGGARLATLSDIGDLTQELESIVLDASNNKHELDDSLRGEIETLFNRLKVEISRVKAFQETQAEAEQEQTPEIAEPQEKATDEKLAEQMMQFQREQPAAPAKAKEEKPATPAPAAPRQAPVDTIRVSAPLLEGLVNLAGETSIARGLLEQQISDFGYTLEEMQATIDRQREQLRRMDMETEAQVLFRMEKEGGPEYEDFDPLEMDRYSSIQQLSRALGESSSDLTDLRETLMNKTRDAETLLLQQSRINTELQEGLMKTRMVPFTSTVPRLRRIIRQVSTELGKKVDFEVYNPEGELDRTVLERMIAPLEHMLRNAVDHGVEMPDVRAAAGKSETGRIELSIGREGGDVVLILSDDGGGINVDAIRKKAVKQGLLDEGMHVSDHDVLQFIFHAGFSTAEKVTQISGRGVGMDVVASEIKQLGGRVSIDSKPGKGTRFIVHLPFTVSVNRALMVNTGEDYYAIPLNTIEGIVRVSTYELEEYYKPDAPLYEYAGQRYRLQYLGSLLNSEHHPKLQGQVLPLPVILVRGGGDKPLALQVDSLMGSREIVVKGLGPQFANVRGVSGATILGDGSVVVILDLPALLRTDITTQLHREVEQPAEAARSVGPTKVMVVDDSVTVRKVTSRLLERNGMEVITAKDGVDAIAILQDHKPDVMLLDIEMPRMDGFEVASLVRHDSRLKDVPIIMITSRTGQKHRERALSIGVNEYLGKPFQESVLLDTIESLVDKR
ncbi:hybrid sensor histidine kinase/response regulator [Hahella sp. CCB-MM4]|uniref:hybrid sensor histidine kinase/response regulator n=1 Tax=Hahella sp. (strain CCB-MM4) TaxID=1926491 RepID=UPI000B9B2125|nr:Hpt domain-containing protein [Hahella sp. CCB-MM4]OZG75153.1 hybrid sensor histidine kinase/response regulator [Hahella sp. CCB-MM4]